MNIDRRDFLKVFGGGVAAAALAQRHAGATAQTTTTSSAGATAPAASGRPVTMAFIGVGDRGTGLLRNILNHFPEVQVPAVCDIDEGRLKRAQDLVEKARGKRPEGYSKGPQDYKRMLERDDFESVLIGTPQEVHAEQAVACMKKKKFVGSETPACTTIDECWQIIRGHEETGTGYFFLENYVYQRPVMQVLMMAQKQLFGDLTYGEGAYIHEIRGMRFKDDGSLTWRGENIQKNIGIIYPTHAVGPVCQWMEIGKSDRMTRVVAMATKSLATHQYAVKRFGPDSAPAKVKFGNGDSNNGLIETEQGRVIALRYDTASPRPSGSGEYQLQGTKGCYKSEFGIQNVYLEHEQAGSGGYGDVGADASDVRNTTATEGQTTPTAIKTTTTKRHEWERLENYRAQYDHPYWREREADATKTGHGGADYFVLKDFIDAIRTGKPAIDVYDGVSWSSIRPLSAESIRNGGKPMEIPDFRKNKKA